MVRRTKEESEKTRCLIIEAARDAFLQRGVSHTTMEQIAQAAGVTRGAIYWHFANKMALFYAMREQVELPLIDRADFTLLQCDKTDPLKRLENFMLALMEMLTKDSDTRCTFEIMAFKCEYVDGFEIELQKIADQHEELLVKLTTIYRQADRHGQLRPDLSPTLAAIDTMVFLSGLSRLWLLDEAETLVRRKTRALIVAHVNSRRACAPAQTRKCAAPLGAKT